MMHHESKLFAVMVVVVQTTKKIANCGVVMVDLIGSMTRVRMRPGGRRDGWLLQIERVCVRSYLPFVFGGSGIGWMPWGVGVRGGWRDGRMIGRRIHTSVNNQAKPLIQQNTTQYNAQQAVTVYSWGHLSSSKYGFIMVVFFRSNGGGCGWMWMLLPRQTLMPSAALSPATPPLPPLLTSPQVLDAFL